MTFGIQCAVVFFLLRCYAISSARGLKSIDHLSTLRVQKDANLSTSYDLIATLKIQSYVYDYDSVPNRQQFGVIGQTCEKIHQDTTGFRRVIDKLEVRDPSDPSTTVVVTNYQTVDTTQVFMHNVVATQALMLWRESLDASMGSVSAQLEAQQQHTLRLDTYLNADANASVVELRRVEEAKSANLALEINLEKTKGDEERSVIDHRAQVEHEIEASREAFAVRRLAAEEDSRAAQDAALVDLQENSSNRLELARRETEMALKERQIVADRENVELEANASIARASIDVDGRIKQQRMNEDIEMRQLEQKNKAEMTRLLRAVQMTFDNIGSGFVALLSNETQLMWLLGSLISLAAGICIVRETVRVLGVYIEQHLGKPSLVRETSRSTGFMGFVSSLVTRTVSEQVLTDVVLANELQTRILEVARSTINSKKHCAPFRHLLLYGPPGTGKTMVAKRLARCSGLDYALMSGGDVGPLGSDAVTELHRIFQWAKSSPKGLLLFIDEAEAFLGSRGRTDMSENMRNALNAILYQTGEASQKFMLVIATNRPEDLDEAITDRIDETLHFGLPRELERRALLQMYYTQYILEAHCVHNEFGKTITQHRGRWRSTLMSLLRWTPRRNAMTMQAIDASAVSKSDLTLIAKDSTAGMSGREISKLMLYLQSVVYGQNERVVTSALLHRVVKDKVQEHTRKVALKAKIWTGRNPTVAGSATTTPVPVPVHPTTLGVPVISSTPLLSSDSVAKGIHTPTPTMDTAIDNTLHATTLMTPTVVRTPSLKKISHNEATTTATSVDDQKNENKTINDEDSNAHPEYYVLD